MSEKRVLRLFKQASIQFLDELQAFNLDPAHAHALKIIRMLIDTVQTQQLYDTFVGILNQNREALMRKDESIFSDPENDLLKQLGQGLIPPVLSNIWRDLDDEDKNCIFGWIDTLTSIVDEYGG